MNLRMGLESLTQGVMEKAVKLMSDRYTDNEKMGIGLSMALDVKDGLGAYLEVVDRLDEMNGKLLAQNRELMSKLESIQKSEELFMQKILNDIESNKAWNEYKKNKNKNN